jgi:hypothetical protein
MTQIFSSVSLRDWKLSSVREWKCKTFQDLVEELKEEFEVCLVKRVRFNEYPKFFRVEIKIKAPIHLVQAFHCAEFGYRAQYYLGEDIGISANSYVIERIRPKLIDNIKRINKLTCKQGWVSKSLASTDTKIWIHQGAWLRKREHQIRNLEVDHWLKYINNSDKEIAKKALWSTLVPEEDKLDIKGGFVVLDCSDSKPNLKSNRAEQIHEYGFT